ncbi:GGDEF domain-containing protein [Granulicella arctica]|uniref:GGDEF domain-containing protein n=1 Tax=Granulicella arctica TaxID=940613 RepID=UPI0021DFFBA4|nr:GGDEF domain-containing protein [Granulicella arctica]
MQLLRHRVVKMGSFRAAAWITAIAEVMAILLALMLVKVMGYSTEAVKAVMTAASTLPLIIAPIVGGTIVLLLEDLETARLALEELSTRDGLTSLFNRTYFMDRLRREMAQAVRHHMPLSLLMVDTDNFKQINDRYGHTAGDHVLQSLAHTCTLLLREGDVLARYGGEEFVLLLPATSEDGAWQVAEKLRSALEAMRVTLIDLEEPMSITVSIGLSGRQGQDDTADALFGRADRALYRAKLAGKNRCVVDGKAAPITLAEPDSEEIVDVEDADGRAFISSVA